MDGAGVGAVRMPLFDSWTRARVAGRAAVGLSRLVCCAGIGALLAAAAPSLYAQSSASESFPQVRRGWWGSVGVGYGRLDFSCGGGISPWDSTPPAPSCPEAGHAPATLFSLRAGYALSQQLLVSLTTDAWRRVGSSDGAWDFGLAARWYPIRTRGLFVEASVSRSTFGVRDPWGPDEVGRGIGLMAALGWDLRVDRNFSLTPVVLGRYGHQGDTGIPSVTIFPDGSKLATRTRVHETVIGLGLAVTFH